MSRPRKGGELVYRHGYAFSICACRNLMRAGAKRCMRCVVAYAKGSWTCECGRPKKHQAAQCLWCYRDALDKQRISRFRNGCSVPGCEGTPETTTKGVPRDMCAAHRKRQQREAKRGWRTDAPIERRAKT